jgi:hypothetical protein
MRIELLDKSAAGCGEVMLIIAEERREYWEKALLNNLRR